MKNKLLYFFAIILLAKNVFALPYELYFYIHDGSNFVRFLIEVYNSSNQLYSSGYTQNYGAYQQYGDANGAGQIYPHTEGATFAYLPRSGTWRIVIGTKYFTLNLDNYQSGDLKIEYNVVTHNMSINVVASPGPFYYGPSSMEDKHEIQLTNSFANATNGSGLFNINSSLLNNSYDKRLYQYYTSSQFPLTVAAVTGLSQIYPSVSGTPRIFQNWTGDYSGSSQSFEVQTATNFLATASFYNGFKVTFSNSYGSSFTDGIINADGQQRSSPYMYAIVQGSYTSASAINQNKYVPNSNNYIELTLDHWSTTLPVTPAQNDQTYFCYLKGKPIHANRNLRANDSSFGSNVQLTWNEFNDPDITGYQIWRRVKHNGVLSDPVMIAFVSNRFTTSYIDYDYVISLYLVDLLKYDVRAVYDPGYFNGWDQPAITTEINYIDVFGQMSLFINSDDSQLSEISLEQGLPSEYSLSNYPNPFNPTTTINYQLPEIGFVTLKVFDILGKEVSLLVNENKSAGYYTVNFDGSNLTSGVYIYTIQVNGITQSKKMLLTK